MEDSHEAIRRLTTAINKIDGGYYFCARHLGLNENMVALLYALDDGKPHSQKEICRDWLIPKTTINTVVRELVREGYVTLIPDGHRREKIIRLTPSGEAYCKGLIGRFYDAEQEALGETLKDFSPEFIRAMEHFADRLEEAFDRHIIHSDRHITHSDIIDRKDDPS